METSTIYFKITNINENHNGYQYQDGLNILDKPFDEKGSCAVGGLYFTTINHIHEYYKYGIYLREIHLPTDDPEFKMVEDPARQKYRANKIILGAKYSLFDPATYIKFGLDMTKNDYLYYFASEHGLVKELDQLKNIMYNLDHYINGINIASANGNINVLEWFLHCSGPDLMYTRMINIQIPSGGINLIKPLQPFNAIDFAAAHGRIDVLDWFSGQGFELKYINAIDIASANGHTNVLQWVVRSGLDLEYTDSAIDIASANGHAHVLEWFSRAGLKMKYTNYAIDWASAYGHVNILEWFFKSDLELKYTVNAIDWASKLGRIDALVCWKNRPAHLPLKYTCYAIEGVLEFTYFETVIDGTAPKEILNWWKDSGLKMVYTHKAMDDASKYGRIDVLNWFKCSGLELKYSDQAIYHASANNHIDALDWWKMSGLDLKYTVSAINEALHYERYDVIKWWRDSGLEIKYSDYSEKNYLRALKMIQS